MSEENEMIFDPKIFYLKDSVFKGTLIPQIFFNKIEITTEMNISVNYSKVGDNPEGEMWNILLTFTVIGKNAENSEVAYEIVSSYGGLFQIANYKEEDIGKICRVHCASVIFPYLREEIMNKVIKSGIPSISIKPMNFSLMYENQIKEELLKKTEQS